LFSTFDTYSKQDAKLQIFIVIPKEYIKEMSKLSFFIGIFFSIHEEALSY